MNELKYFRSVNEDYKSSMEEFIEFIRALYSDKCEKWRMLRTDQMGDKVLD